jgi:hypothetical protein
MNSENTAMLQQFTNIVTTPLNVEVLKTLEDKAVRDEMTVSLTEEVSLRRRTTR